jgi:hypothetical protein
MNKKLVDICKRACELDRPILMRDKIDMFWNEARDPVEIETIHQKMRQRKK